MWWPFRRKRKPELLLIVEDELLEEFLTGRYETRMPMFFDKETGFRTTLFFTRPHTYSPDTPYILESGAQRIEEELGTRLAHDSGRTPQSEAASENAADPGDSSTNKTAR